jgi:hypothetical protein
MIEEAVKNLTGLFGCAPPWFLPLRLSDSKVFIVVIFG